MIAIATGCDQLLHLPLSDLACAMCFGLDTHDESDVDEG